MRNIRDDFPLLRDSGIAYLDSAATAQRPSSVLDAEREFYEKRNANPLRGLYSLGYEATEAYEAARERVRRFLNAEKREEIIFTRNTTESINLAAYSCGLNALRPGDEILVTVEEHHSNLLPWQMAAKKTGADLVFLECAKDGTFREEAVRKAVTPRTKLAAVTHISNVLGRINPVEELIRLVHEHGGAVLVDAAQSAPHIPLDVRKMDADFLAFSGHKVLGPMGIGVLYGKEELLGGMEPFLTGGEMIESVARQNAVFAPLPHRFEAGTVNAAGAVGLAAALDYLDSVGFEEIRRREEALTEMAFEGMKRIPAVRILGSQRAKEHCGILSFTVDGVHPHDIATLLDMDGVAVRAGHHCAQPLLEFLGVLSSARASIAFYNTEEDIERFLRSLSAVRRRMGYGK